MTQPNNQIYSLIDTTMHRLKRLIGEFEKKKQADNQWEQNAVASMMLAIDELYSMVIMISKEEDKEDGSIT